MDSRIINELAKENTFFLNIDLKLCAIVLCVIVICLMLSLITPMFSRKQYKRCEYFDNDVYHLYKNINYANHAIIPLSSGEDLQNDENVLFGQATRYVSVEAESNKQLLIDSNNSYASPIYFILDVVANLYVLSGEVYNSGKQSVLKQKYYVKLRDEKNNKSVILGDLVKDGDGFYKLKYKIDLQKVGSDIGDLLNYNKIEIIYAAYDLSNKETKNTVIISGNLNHI